MGAAGRDRAVRRPGKQRDRDGGMIDKDYQKKPPLDAGTRLLLRVLARRAGIFE